MYTTFTAGAPSYGGSGASLARMSNTPFVKSRCMRVASAMSLPITPSKSTNVHRCARHDRDIVAA